MNLESLFKLPVTLESVTTIDTYLQTTTLPVKTYQAVFVHGLVLRLELARYDEVLALGSDYYEKNKHIETLSTHEKLFFTLYKAALHVKAFDEAYKYINLRKHALPIKDKYLAIFDLIEFKKATYQSYKMELESLLYEVLPDLMRHQVLSQLIDLYLHENQATKVLTLVDELKKIDPKETYIPAQLKSFYILERFEDAKALAQQYINHSAYDMDAYLVLLKIYLIEKDYHKATILDADFEERLEDQDIHFLNEVYPLLIRLYEERNNPVSLAFYQKKYKALQRQEKKQKKVEKGTTETNQAEVIHTAKAVGQHDTKVSFLQLEQAFDLLTYSHQLSEHKVFRDYLRHFFIRLDEMVETVEYVIYEAKTATQYHYKKERLYDKQIAPTTLSQTCIETIIDTGEDLFGVPQALKNQQNIITQKRYDDTIGYVYGFALYDLGVFLVHLKDNVKDPGEYYDFFKFISGIIYARLIDEKQLHTLRETTQFYEQLFESPLSPMRMMEPLQTKYNVAAQKMLQLTSHQPYDNFLRDISPLDIKNYEQMIHHLYQKANQVDEMTYYYQNRQIKERLVSLKFGDDIRILSVFEDLSYHAQEKMKLLEKAVVDYDTGLNNLNALNQEILTFIKDKGSFMLIELNDHIKTIYGYETALQYFKEFGHITRKFFNDGQTYRFNTQQLFVYIPHNDIRTVTKRVKDYLRYLESYETQTISYERFLPKISIIRYPVVTEEKLPAKLYRYLELALDHLKYQQIDESYIFFEHRIYEEEMYEQQIIDVLNEAINHQQMMLTFNQIIDLNRQIVWQYESDLTLQNVDIDSKYLLSIAKKRNRLVDLERYHIKLVVLFLQTLEKETNKLIKLTIPISKETFIDATFNTYVIGLFKRYEIPYNFIRFKIKAADLKGSHYIRQMDELAELGIGLDATHIDVALNYPFHALHLDFKKDDVKWQNYIVSLKDLLQKHQMALIIRDIKHKDHKMLVEKLGITYMGGTVYKKITSDMLLYKIKGIKDEPTSD